jgi:hypothetical protein
MRFRRHSPDAFELCDIHPLFAELLAELPRAASRHGSARSRLYPDPVGPGSADGGAEDLADWHEHVHPELERLFAASREKVSEDLGVLGAKTGSVRCVIPRENIDAWLNALNQARLVIVEENKFAERELSGAEPPDLSTRRGLSLLKVHFYAHLQELLVEAAG